MAIRHTWSNVRHNCSDFVTVLWEQNNEINYVLQE